MIKRVQTLKKIRTAKKPKTSNKTGKKTVAIKLKKASASDTVLAIISKRKKGLNTATLRKMTGIDDNKMRGIVFRLKKTGKIKNDGRGVYLKA